MNGKKHEWKFYIECNDIQNECLKQNKQMKIYNRMNGMNVKYRMNGMMWMRRNVCQLIWSKPEKTNSHNSIKGPDPPLTGGGGGGSKSPSPTPLLLTQPRDQEHRYMYVDREAVKQYVDAGKQFRMDGWIRRFLNKKKLI